LAVLAACLIQRTDFGPYTAGLPAASTDNWQDTAPPHPTASAISPAWVTPNPSFSFSAAGADDANGTAKLLTDQDPSFALSDLTRMQELLNSIQGSGSTDPLAGYLLENNPFNTGSASAASQLSGFGSDFMSDLAQFGEGSVGGGGGASGHHGHKFVVPHGILRLAKGPGDILGLNDNISGPDLTMTPTVPAFDTQSPPAAPLPSAAWGGLALLAGLAAWQLMRRRTLPKTQSAE